MSYQVCPTTVDDRSTILRLWERNLPEAPAGRYGWLYDTGPADDWLLQDEEHGAIGSIGLMRRDFRVRNRPVAAGQAVDMNVDQAHRTIGPALQLQRIALEAAARQNLPFVYGIADPRSQLVLRRAGYRPLGDVGRWVKLLRSEPLLSQRLPWNWLRRSCSKVLDLAMLVVGRECRHRRGKGTRVEVVDRFDRRFDRLWEHAAARLPIVGERSSSYLNWRFGDTPDICYRAFVLRNADGRLRSYLVYHLEQTTAHICDFLYDEPVDFADLLPDFVRFARCCGMETIVAECLIPESLARILHRFGFWQRPSHWPMLVFAPKASIPQWSEDGLFDLENWYLTRADVDTDS